MRVGLSLSRCVRDIFEEKVDIDDILVIVARTNFDPKNDKHWDSIWKGYTGTGSWGAHPEWIDYKDHEQEFRDIITTLNEKGKLHQPRLFGAHPPRLPWYWLETTAPEEDVEKNPAVKKAWENYKILAGLS